MAILLVVPKLKSMFGDPNAVPGHPHTGIAYLSSFAKSKGVQVELYDGGVDSEEELNLLLQKNRFDLIGVTAFSYSLRYVYEVIDRLKQLTDSPIVVGGPHVSVSKGDILNKSRADFAVKGEGEETLLALLEAIKSGQKEFSAVEGLIWKSPKGIVENRDRETLRDIETPYPDYESFKLERYLCSSMKSLPFITQRGCPYKCNFCSVPLSMGQSFRFRTPENVLAEFKHWHSKGWKHFQVNDDVFNIRRDRVMEICRLLIESGMKITWELYNGIRVNVVDPEMLKAMKDAGCVLISYGCESGNPEILKLIRKGLTLEQVRRASEMTAASGIRFSVNFIVGHPTETYEKALDSIRFAKSLPATFVNFYNDTPYPGTELFEWVKENAKILFPDFLHDYSYRSGEPIYETPEFTREERLEILRQGYKLYERKILRYRLGGTLGLAAYLLTRLPPVHRLGRAVVYTKSGWRIFNKLGRRFGGMVWLPD